MEDQEDFKYKLKSIDHYKYLDSHYKFGGSHSECDLLQRKFPSKQGIYDFCLSLRGNLDYFDELNNLGLFKNDKCQYLNCWIHDRLLNLGFVMNGEESASIFFQILEYFSFFNLSEKCKYEFFHINKEKYEKMKKLYDYVLDFTKIEWYATTYGCTEENKQYINERRRIYQEVKEDCGKDTRQPYCIVLEHLKEAYANDELANFECTKFKSSPLHAEAGGRLQGDHRRDSGHLQHDLGPDSDPRGQFPSASLGQTEESSFPSSTPMAVSFPFLGSLLTVFTLYKFTPVGSWLRTPFLPNKMNTSNMGEVETLESVENDYENVNLNPHMSKHLIGYNPLEDEQF
ncbi:PIR Superfamily Protein [Plasmodium ovale wallikeri]|uniref:PIR Superfamily Protein n=2 Tax=Plasmodium ovale TaxID=36330 RepID=A0A1A9ADH0_PLAOA|nr:PIR Superfamily Protein [Plasmodium ovale wallikeri]SBT56164.1 PIR Superfamily Protein [Plasmodium ovale wallikeri]SBT73095.1 PIR protein [Plasmodium ovale]